MPNRVIKNLAKLVVLARQLKHSLAVTEMVTALLGTRVPGLLAFALKKDMRPL